MTSTGLGHYVVVVLRVGESKASDINLVLQRGPRTAGKTQFPTCSILPNEEHVDVDVRELLEEAGLTLTLDDLTLLSDAPVRVSLPEGQRQLVYVFSAFVTVPYVTTNLRTPPKLEQVVTPQATTNSDGSYVVPATIDFDGFSLTPAKHGLLPVLKRMFEFLHFGYVTQ
jgi:8-oxo-dGTP pyrophosphatase MutT (NUDIX family)